MTFETATQIGIDLIAPAVTLFTLGYAFRPWMSSHIGRAIMAHALGSVILFDVAVATQYGLLPPEYPGHEWVTMSIIVLWVIGWWYMVAALWLTREHRNDVG